VKRKLQLNVLPKIFPRVAKNQKSKISVSPLLIESAQIDSELLLSRLETSLNGLTSDKVEQLFHKYGLNIVKQENRHTFLWFLRGAIINPLVILLCVIGLVSFLSGDLNTTIIISVMVLLGVVLRFLQEYRADVAAAKLQAMINVTATVVRDGVEKEIPISHIVPGDIVKLSAGDMIPADVRLLSCKDLFITQSSLTGESLPVEKFCTIEENNNGSPLELQNICFLGTNVESGSGIAVVVATGLNTYLGRMAQSITEPQAPTSFDIGIKKFTWLMIRFMFVMVPLVFLINFLTKGNLGEAFFFSIAVAVGLTPEMLPMIVTVCLSKGSLLMSKKKVIIKRLNSIQNLGAMDILCTDKTGTLTIDHVILKKYCDVVQREDEEVLMMAFLNSHFQTGLRNVLDRAIIQSENIYEKIHISEYQKVDEIPFDFSRKIMSVIVETPDGIHRMISKGAPEEIFARCTDFELDGEIHPLEQILIEDLKEEYKKLSIDGFRVLALAYKDFEKKSAYTKNDESGMILKGYLAFLDPPKVTAKEAIQALQENGITIKVLTGDNELVTRKICQEVGLNVQQIMLGSEIERLTDEELTEKIDEYTIFARLAPSDKQRIVRILRNKGHTVGYMGDGINDAPALYAADVSISVNSAVDIAKESSDIILLENSLMVLKEGVIEGRKVFANILKYIRMSASSNFGNMFSVLGASIFLPFLPMLPIQILVNNLLYDLSQTPIPTDAVDYNQISKPRQWELGNLTRFILFIGPISSIFDYTTFFIMLYIFGCWDPARASLFQTGWFVESLLTQTLIIHVIRTNKIPFLQSRASLPLLFMTILVMGLGIYIPHSFFATYLGFTTLPTLYWPLLVLTLLSYISLTQIIKMWLLKKNWI